MNTIQPVPIAADHRLDALVQELARYGLGVFRPHKHLSSGELVPLPAGEVALERGLHTTFSGRAEAPAGAIPVGWRWNGQAVEVFALCCDNDDEFNPPAAGA